MKRTLMRDLRALAIYLLAPAVGLLLTGSIAGAQEPVEGTLYTFHCAGTGATVATDINDSGTIVGRCSVSGSWHGFIYTKGESYADGSVTLLDVPGATATEAWGINEQGEVVGFYYKGGDPTYHGFVRRLSGDYETIDRQGEMNTMPEDINDGGYVAGCVHNNGLMHGFVFSGDAFLSIEPATSMHTGVNESGTLVGYGFTPPAGAASFILSGVDRIDFSYPGATNTQAWGLNQAGDVVGWYGVAASSKGFLRLHAAPLGQPDDQFKQVAIAGAAWTRAFGINEAGVIVGGYAQDGIHGFVLVQ